jgi:hypothetical protein
MYEEPPAMYELEEVRRMLYTMKAQVFLLQTALAASGVDLTVTVTQSQPQGATLPGTTSVVQTGM